MIDLKKLRELAEKAKEFMPGKSYLTVHTDRFTIWTQSDKEICNFDNSDLSFKGIGRVTWFLEQMNPSAIIELLDRLEAAERVCDAQEKWRKSETFQEYDLAQNECALALKAWQEVSQCADQQQKKS